MNILSGFRQSFKLIFLGGGGGAAAAAGRSKRIQRMRNVAVPAFFIFVRKEK